MTIKEIEAKTILNRQKRIDSWFLSRYSMNIYRGCAHDCVYCDARSEKYRVEGDFGKDVTVKTNAAELLDKALSPARKRVPLKRGFILLGGGVGDSYQPLEKKTALTRQALKVIESRGFPVHVLTKSTLVERDVDILTRIGQNASAIVSMSLSSADDAVSKRVEPHCPPPGERLRLLSKLKEQGLKTAVFLLPVLPGITDTQDCIDHSVKQIARAGVDFVLFGGLTLKPGRQKETYYDFIANQDPGLPGRYDKIYLGNKWGRAVDKYYRLIEDRFTAAALRFRVARRVPSPIFSSILDENDKLVVILENLDYFARTSGERARTTGNRSPFGYAAHTISQLKEPVSKLGQALWRQKGIGSAVRPVVEEIMETGISELHESYFF